MRKHSKNHFFRNKMIQFIQMNSKLYILLILLFFIGLSIGIIVMNHTNEESKLQIQTYINQMIENLKSDKEINEYQLMLSAVTINVGTILLFFLLGTTIIGMPLIYLLMVYKGYSLGYTISALIASIQRKRRNFDYLRPCSSIFYLYSSNDIFSC